MWLNNCLKYNYNSNETIKKTEDILKSEISELVKEVETNEIENKTGFNRPFTSISVKKNEFKVLLNERKFFLEKLLHVSYQLSEIISQFFGPFY